MAPRSSWPRLAALLLLLAAVALVLMAGIDQNAQQWFQTWRFTPTGQGLAQGAYWAGLGGTQAALLAGLTLWGWYRHQPRHRGAGLSGLASVLVSGVLVQVCKHLAGRPRPRLALPASEYFGPTFQSDLLSFPSGHAATSFAVAAALSVFYPRMAWLFYALAALIALGRVVSNAHYLSDVMAGAALGLAVGWPLAGLVARRAAGRP
ncbi:MAG: phosphatase PAP2 family protein [Pseudomonadota bacterium]